MGRTHPPGRRRGRLRTAGRPSLSHCHTAGHDRAGRPPDFHLSPESLGEKIHTLTRMNSQNRRNRGFGSFGSAGPMHPANTHSHFNLASLNASRYHERNTMHDPFLCLRRHRPLVSAGEGPRPARRGRDADTIALVLLLRLGAALVKGGGPLLPSLPVRIPC